jgi:predicted phage terminase large subunit-like protein
MDKGDLVATLARKSFGIFSKVVFPPLEFAAFHKTYYSVLQAFAEGRIKRLIVTMPPQHGKSQGSTCLLPAYLLGRNPDLRVAVASYSDTFAKKFNRDIQRIIDQPSYAAIFPDTALNGSNVVTVSQSYLRNSSEFEIVGHRGSLKAVGRGGGLTGNPVDVMIMDDLYKDSAEGNSPTIRDAAWEWYTSVARTRLHNNSQELIVFTRWHEDDLIGRIEQTERVITLTSLADIDTLPQGQDVWAKVNFEAIKEDAPTELDNRTEGQPLWAERHGAELLQAKRKLDPHNFECLYQGKPASREGLLYSSFKTYNELPPPAEIIKRTAYVDTADTGEDYLCAISYCVAKDGYCYITDILYTQEPMEVTEQATANLLTRNDCRSAAIESNNGGRGFARNVQRLAPRVKVEWFHQSGNKESRILSNSATVQHNILMPSDWALRFPLFFAHLTAFKRLFRANSHDDCADAITGIAEKEYQTKRRTTMIV